MNEQFVVAQTVMTAFDLLCRGPAVVPEMLNAQVYDAFSADPDLHMLPVVDDGRPIGLITRANLINRFARPYQRELYGKKPCVTIMDANPLMVDKDTSLQQLSLTVAQADLHHLSDGFIITDGERYLGTGIYRWGATDRWSCFPTACSKPRISRASPSASSAWQQRLKTPPARNVSSICSSVRTPALEKNAPTTTFRY